jgi:transcriptional regulator with XRE-family HTH domain
VLVKKGDNNMLKLKEIRLKKGLKQSDIAKILGVTRQSATRYELEQSKLNQDEIIKLCLALDVTPDELLGYEEAYQKYTEYLKTLDEEDSLN